MTSPITKSAQDIINRANFRPVFDIDNNLVGISELKVETDRRAGIEAMDELFAVTLPGDDVAGADGLTLKQKRLLASPAPLAAHYLKATRKWDAATNEHVPGLSIILPFEVVWHMFEKLFPFPQHSVRVDEIVHENEEVPGATGDMKGQTPDDMTGRAFYTRASVTLVVHLANGQTREFTGVGVAFGDIPMSKTGNVRAITNAHRTADKGAISDAKREALASMGALFRRAFEDGDDMIDQLQGMIEATLAERNKPRIQASVPADIVAAPRARPVQTSATKAPKPDPKKAEAPEEAASEKAEPDPVEITPEDERHENTFATVALHLSEEEMMMVAEDAFAEQLLEAALGTETREEFDALLKLNAAVIEALVDDRAFLDEIRGELPSSEADNIPDFDVPPATPSQPKEGAGGDDNSMVIEITAKTSGKSVLDEMIAMIKRARQASEVDAITARNGAAMRKLTPKQMKALLEAQAARLSELG